MPALFVLHASYALRARVATMVPRGVSVTAGVRSALFAVEVVLSVCLFANVGIVVIVRNFGPHIAMCGAVNAVTNGGAAAGAAAVVVDGEC